MGGRWYRLAAWAIAALNLQLVRLKSGATEYGVSVRIFLSMEEEIFCLEARSVDKMEKTRFGCSVIVTFCDRDAFTHQCNRTESRPIQKTYSQTEAHRAMDSVEY